MLVFDNCAGNRILPLLRRLHRGHLAIVKVRGNEGFQVRWSRGCGTQAKGLTVVTGRAADLGSMEGAE